MNNDLEQIVETGYLVWWFMSVPVSFTADLEINDSGQSLCRIWPPGPYLAVEKQSPSFTSIYNLRMTY